MPFGTVIGRIIEYHSTIGWDEVIISITTTNGLGGIKGIGGLGGMTGGDCILSDDDLGDESTFKIRTWGCNDQFAAGSVLQPPDVSALEIRYRPAYIEPVLDASTSSVGGITLFKRNVIFGALDYGKAIWDQAKSATVRQLPISSPEFWTVFVFSAWQAEEDRDSDPNGEELTTGIGTHSTGGSTSAIFQLGSSYTGICAIFKALMNVESDVPEEFIVAHEIGHLLGLPHSAEGLMTDIEPDGAGTAEQSKPFSGDSLSKLRQYNGP